MNDKLNQLAQQLEGELHYDSLMRTLYATDASVYRELPLAVALPKHAIDIQHLIKFAQAYQVSLIPRAAGTSLAGQCVGKGIVVDVSKYMTEILEINLVEKWVRVQPGVVRDELNTFLKPYGLFFGPNTSTANRCMIGGMVGNNSCGTTSIVYGSTRDHVLELQTLLSDGSLATFKSLSPTEFQKKLKGNSLENKLYQQLYSELQQPNIQSDIRQEFPKASIHRRNTGYAVDYLLNSNVFTEGGEDFNFCKLLCGSEGTLAFTTEIKLHIDPLPLPEAAVVAAHFDSIEKALKATIIAMKHRPTACELMDKIILDCTKDNIEQQKNRYFVQGDPAAILMVEFRGTTIKEAAKLADKLIADFEKDKMAYACPTIFPPFIQHVWDLRKAGLGLLANIPGDKKAVACIEDTAVDVEDLPAYIAEFSNIMEGFGQRSVYYAHAGAGELHLRPILDLKKSKDIQLFHDISEASARLVKKYQGSLSGEHGDGRVRAEFIPLMIGEANYQLLHRIKDTWDAAHIFNPGKIVNAPPMNTNLRYEPEQNILEIKTVFDFTATQGILRAAEKCNGSGDCRKLNFAGGTMCPSYRVTRDEKDTTRGRANVLREFLTQNTKENPFDHPEIKTAMDLCLSCKGCKSECPSNVDMATLKAEFLHQYYQTHGVPFRAKAFANIGRLNALAATFPKVSNFFLKNKISSFFIKKVLDIAPERSMPLLYTTTLRRWFEHANANAKRDRHVESVRPLKGTVYFFCDEFTNFNDTLIGIKAIQLLHALGYEVKMPEHAESGRAQLSKGLLLDAQKMAQTNVSIFKNKVSDTTPLIGIEPSAILSFRDEYPNLVKPENKAAAKKLAKNTFLMEEFLAREIEKRNITAKSFSTKPRQFLLHGHCHQKALSSVMPTVVMLSLPVHYHVEVIPSGCCGMAGSFGYEKEHYDLSMSVGEEVLFPAVRKSKSTVEIVAPGTSCRHQILDGTGKTAVHPVEVLWEALIK